MLYLPTTVLYFPYSTLAVVWKIQYSRFFDLVHAKDNEEYIRSYVCIMFNCVHLIYIIQKRLKVMENKLLEEKHQRKLLQDCTEQVIILYYDIVYNIVFIPTYAYTLIH